MLLARVTAGRRPDQRSGDESFWQTNVVSQPAGGEFEATMLAEARAEVLHADHKATLVLTGLGVGGGALLAGVIAGDWQPSRYHAPGEAIWWFGVAASLLSVVFAAIAVWPRWNADDVANGVFYWGHVATFDSEAQLASALGRQSKTHIERDRHQLFQLSRIVARKYRWVRRAMSSAAIAGCVFGLAALTGN